MASLRQNYGHISGNCPTDQLENAVGHLGIN
jgi:hypothetical protein